MFRNYPFCFQNIDLRNDGEIMEHQGGPHLLLRPPGCGHESSGGAVGASPSVI